MTPWSLRASIQHPASRNVPVKTSRRLALAASLAAVLFACARPRASTLPEPVRVSADMSDEAVLRAKTLMVPVAGMALARLRDTFGAARGAQIHEALDILAPRGTQVLAADDGVLIRMRRNEAGGITIYQIDGAERFVYYYAHLDRYREGLAEGTRVHQGEVLGYVGTTGNAPPNTPHLHFQLMRYAGNGRYWGGEPVNPLPYLTRAGNAP